MIQIGKVFIRSRGALSVHLENALLTVKVQNKLAPPVLQSNLNLIIARGVKTTDTIHPLPVYNEDEKVLKKVMEERLKEDDDLPIGMANPYEKPKQKCILCANGVTPNWKNIKLLYQFVSPYTGLLYERHVTGLCKKQYERVEHEFETANKLGLMSNYVKQVEFLKDPVICDPERPIKPHKWC